MRDDDARGGPAEVEDTGGAGLGHQHVLIINEEGKFELVVAWWQSVACMYLADDASEGLEDGRD